MRITKISVKGLFGMFDHEIPLNQESRITIVHGPNGVGKTVLLRLVHGLFDYEYEYLGQTPFDELRLEFAGPEYITVRKNVQVEDGKKLTILDINYDDNTGEDYIAFEPAAYDDFRLDEFIKKMYPDYRFAYVINERRAYWIKNNILTFTRQEMLNMYPKLHTEVYGEIPEWFSSMQEAAKTQLIVTDRLRLESMGHEVSLARIVTSQLESKDQEYGPDYIIPSPPSRLDKLSEFKEFADGVIGSELWERASRNLDRFIIELDELIEKIKDHNTRSSWLVEELEDITGWSIAENWDHYDFLSFELKDLRKHREFALRVKLFLDVINERLLFKTVDLGEDKGIKVTADDGNVIPLQTLSSGERHVVILYYQLLFQVNPDTLVMLDEPEISLNVVWQRNFLKDLQRIIELRKFDVLIATHSPEVIFDKWDWLVALGEKADD